MDEEKKSLIKKDNIFCKIKSFFKNFFAKRKIQNIIEPPYGNEEKENVDIGKKTINIVDEKQRLLDLQQKIRNNTIQLEELSDDDIEKLDKLYDEQINKLRDNIIRNKMVTEKYKQQIIKMKSSM